MEVSEYRRAKKALNARKIHRPYTFKETRMTAEKDLKTQIDVCAWKMSVD
jgi:hypothetical protein